MKRDIELVRKLLLYIEENFTYDVLHSSLIELEGYSAQEIGYHLKLMADGGLIDTMGGGSTDSRTYECGINGMTPYGHDFLDSVRDEGVWSNVKAALKPVGWASFEVIKNLAVAQASKMLGLP